MQRCNSQKGGGEYLPEHKDNRSYLRLFAEGFMNISPQSLLLVLNHLHTLLPEYTSVLYPAGCRLRNGALFHVFSAVSHQHRSL